MSSPAPLQYDQYYHIYNRGNNREVLFREDRNYSYFLNLYAKYIHPIADTFAYCLLNNHFHLLVRIKTIEEQETTKIGPASETGPIFKPRVPSRQFNNLFIAYAKAFNKVYQRTGALFESPFKRKRIDNNSYLFHLVTYIHRNPQKHGLVDDFRDWPFSSYRAIQSTKPTQLARETVLTWFDGQKGFEQAHVQATDEAIIAPLISDDQYY
jgi:REP element-mobilizing transposase RayT